jgi:hypothetical protein
MKSLLKYFLFIAVTLLLYSIVSAQQDGTPIFKRDSVEVVHVKKDSLKLFPGMELYRGLFFKETKLDSTKSK